MMQANALLRVYSRRVLNDYVSVTKPGIIFGNLIAVMGGFFLASQGQIDWLLFVATLLGLGLVVASGCAINNVIDRDIDCKMERTRRRVTVTGQLSHTAVLVYGVILGALGFGLLLGFSNRVALGFAIFGYVIYVGIYSLWMKRQSRYGTLIGALSGAVPPVVGYCAVTGQFDQSSALLLLMFTLWQMPHSYAIAIYRLKDYQAAGIPVLPVVAGIHRTKHHMLFYILAFAFVTIMLAFSSKVGWGYWIVALATSVWWLWLGLTGYTQTGDHRLWARKVFVASVVIISVLCLSLAVDYPLASLSIAN